jgi:nucleoside-diphosphate-sugar epimerase
MLANYLDMQDKILWDASKPNGLLYRQLNVEKLARIGFEPKVDIEEGLQRTYKWYSEHLEEARVR